MMSQIFCVFGHDTNIRFSVSIDDATSIVDQLKDAIRAKKGISGSVELLLVRICATNVGGMSVDDLKQYSDLLQVEAYQNEPENTLENMSMFSAARGFCEARGNFTFKVMNLMKKLSFFTVHLPDDLYHVLVLVPSKRSPISSLLYRTSVDFDESAQESTSMKEFWISLSSLVPVNDSLIFNPAPVFCNELPTQFIIRKSYVDIFHIISDKVRDHVKLQGRGTSGFAITGNLGIGKSVFLFYLMWRLRAQGVKTIVLHRAKDGSNIFVFSETGCFIFTDLNDVKRTYLYDKNTWYLTDTLPNGPCAVSAITVVVASPARKHYKEFLKFWKSHPLLYLPVWNLSELLLARKLYDVSAEDVETRFHLIGGIPRFVFDKFEDLDETIQFAVGRLSIEKFEMIVGGNLDKEDEISHLIIHYSITEKYKFASVQFASEYVIAQTLEIFISHQQSKLHSFLLASEGEKLVASLRGNLFEAYAHRQLVKGGTFQVRSLDNNVETTLFVPPLTMVPFKNIEDCVDVNVLYTAARKNYPCIDSLIPYVGLLQMTVSRSHGVKMVELKKAVEDSNLKSLFFVVPHTRYIAYPKQNLLTTDSKVAKRTEPALNNLQQFVLSIDVQ